VNRKRPLLETEARCQARRQRRSSRRSSCRTCPFATGTQAVEFYKRAFGATEISLITSPDGHVVAQLAIDGAQLLVADESPEHANFSPQSLGAVRCVSTCEWPIRMLYRNGNPRGAPSMSGCDARARTVRPRPRIRGPQLFRPKFPYSNWPETRFLADATAPRRYFARNSRAFSTNCSWNWKIPAWPASG